MANRSFLPPLGALECDVVELFCTLVVGASGAVTSGTGKGIASVTKETSAGQYTIALTDAYNAFLWGGCTLLDDTDSSPATVGTEMRFQSQDVSGTAPKVVIQCYAADDGADTNPADGATIYVMLKLRNSSVS